MAVMIFVEVVAVEVMGRVRMTMGDRSLGSGNERCCGGIHGSRRWRISRSEVVLGLLHMVRRKQACV